LASWGTIHKYRTYLEKIFEPQIGMEKKTMFETTIQKDI